MRRGIHNGSRRSVVGFVLLASLFAMLCSASLAQAAEAKVAAGQGHSCAVRTDGDVFCWGSNTYGETGQTDPGDVLVPKRVAGISDAVDVVAGEDFTCALIEGGSVSCWGNNRYGQLGIATDTGGDVAHPTPTAIPALPPVEQLTAGYQHACALHADKSVRCWGYNSYGQNGLTPPPRHRLRPSRR